MTATIGSILNQDQTMNIEVAGKTISIKPLTISDLYSHFEATVKQKQLDRAKELAGVLESSDRVKFMMEIYKSIPSGEAMEAAVSEEMNSISGIQQCFYKAAKSCGADVTLEDIAESINLDTLGDYLPAFYFLLGQEPPKNKEGSKTKSPKKPTAKKTTTRKSSNTTGVK